MVRRMWLMLVWLGLSRAAFADDAVPLMIAPFHAEITPPLGAPLCDGLVPPADAIDDPLHARGVVLLTDPPIVLCALDWVGVGNAGHDAFREGIALAAGTSPDRVAVHCLHQHDAPGCDFLAETIAAEYKLGDKLFPVAFAREVITRIAAAVKQAMHQPRTATHVALGKGLVEGVASSRRILGDDGKIKYVRYSSCRDEVIRACPDGTIDPYVRLISFWEHDTAIASSTWYATHPQSYYGQGNVSADFVGAARRLREQALPELVHLHFNGAAGNITAGKYNDGSPERRPELARKLAAGMQSAWESAERRPIARADVEWRVVKVRLPLSPLYDDEEALLKKLGNEELNPVERLRMARALAFARRTKSGFETPIGCLKLGSAYIVHMPGELFIEYQLFAQSLRPNDFVALAAYGDYGCGYIGTEISYTQGGYETGPVSRVAPSVENVLHAALKELLK